MQLPLLAEKLIQFGYDKRTVTKIFDIFAGKDMPFNVNEVRGFVTYLLETQSLIEQTINTAEEVVKDALLNGDTVEGYALSETSRRSYSNEEAIIEELYKTDYKEKDYLKVSLIGIPALEKLIANEPEEFKEELFNKGVTLTKYPPKVRRK